MRRLLPTNVASLAKLGDRTRPANANVASSVVSRETMQQATLDAEVRSQAVKSQLVSRGNQEVVDIVDRLYNPTATANLVAFTVPAGGVAAFRAIGVFYSEPAICMARVLGWRVMVNGQPIPHLRDVDEGYHFNSFGDLNSPMNIASIWVQAGHTIAIEVTPRYSFAEHVTMLGRLSGRLYNIAAPVILSEGD